MIKIGDSIILEPKYSEKTEKYKCKLVESEGNNLYIDYPINLETNRTVFLIDGTQLKGTFVSSDGTVFVFESKVAGRIKNNIPMVILTYPGSDHLKKIQRRQFVRIETSVDVAVHPLNSEFSPFVSVTDDISAGGAGIIISNQPPIKKDTIIQTWFVLPMQSGENYYLKLNSLVVRFSTIHEEKSVISVQFIDISPHDRQLLLRFSFDRQLALKKKGLEI